MANSNPHLTLVLGGARSGKSRYAEATVMATPAPWIYVATAEPFDDEMKARIAEHRGRRGGQWQTVEAPLDLAGAIAGAPPAATLLVDCLTLWLSNALLLDFDEAQPNAPVSRWDEERSALLRWLADYRGTALLVSNEVGSGIVPASALARRFQDEQGRLNQQLAASCEAVTLVVAGIAVPIKAH